MSARHGHETYSTSAEKARRRAFRQARLHTLLVKSLRVLLPVSSALLLVSYGITFERSFTFRDGKISVDNVRYASDVLTAENPKYEGFNPDGSNYFVTARTADLDLRQKKPIKLRTIRATMTEKSGTVTRLSAFRGLYYEKSRILDLQTKVVVTATNGLQANLTQARVLTDVGRIISRRPSLVTMPSGTVRANRLRIDQTARLVTFDNGVQTHLKPASQTAKPKETGTNRQTSDLQSFGDPTKPTVIHSAQLIINDATKVATFDGNVRATQADAILEAPQLIVQYENAESPGATGGLAAERTAADLSQSGRIKSLVARENIVLTQKGNSATSKTAEFRPLERKASLLGDVVMVSSDMSRVSSDHALFDTVADSVLLTGNVVVVQERNELRGRQLFLDRKVGTTLLTSPATTTDPASTIFARLYQQQAAEGELPRAKKATSGTPGTKLDGNAPLIGGTTFQTNPNEPIDIVAMSFASDDRTSKATFLGEVRARQGDVSLTAEKLIATYAGGSIAGASTIKAAGTATPAARITSIRAEEKVTIVSQADQKATGDWADFDTAKNIVILGGKVTLIRGKQVIRGPKLVIDMTTGISRMETGPRGPGPYLDTSHEFVAGPGQLPNPAKRPQMPTLATTPTAETDCPPGRMCMLMFRDEDTTAKPRKEKPQPARKSSGWSTTNQPQ